MNNYFIKSYHLNCTEIVQSLLISPYGLRHLDQAHLHPERKWGHRLIACIQFLPLIGQLAMCIEWIAYRLLNKKAARKEIQLFRGSQEDGSGSANPQTVHAIFERLFARREIGVTFNPRKITGSIDGGVCSCMALDFAMRYFHLQREHRQTESRFSPAFLKGIRSIGREFARATTERKVRQAAFNTIEVEAHPAGIDIERNKIQSLANLHRLRIDYASAMVPIDRNQNSTLENTLASLPNGLYFLRTNRPAHNEKLEVNGHSLIYAKNGKEGILYDPNHGATYFRKKSHLREIADSLLSQRYHFHHTQSRFYRLCT